MEVEQHLPTLFACIMFTCIMFTCSDEQACIDYLISEGALTIPVLCDTADCTGPMAPTFESNDRPIFRYRCTRCRQRKSLYRFSFCQDVHVPVNMTFLLQYLWLVGTTHKAVGTLTGLSPRTVTRTKQMITMDVEANLVEYVIGGEGVVVEIDESKFGKRKYDEGHHVEGVWVVGGVERTPERKCFAVTVEQRNALSLRTVIERYVLSGSIIYTDCWKGYREEDLVAIGMEYDTVNHRHYWVQPETGVHTNNIEGTFFAVKWLHTPVRQRTRALVSLNLFSFIWRHKHAANL